MHRTRGEAHRYAQMLADLHREPRVVVKLPPVEPGCARDMHGIAGLWYGGVREAEKSDWIADGCEAVETVYPHAAELEDMKRGYAR